MHALLQRTIARPTTTLANKLRCYVILVVCCGLLACGTDDTKDAAKGQTDTAAADAGKNAPKDGENPGDTEVQRPKLPDDLSKNWYPQTSNGGAIASWQPGRHLALGADVRHGKLRDVRGLIHAHSVFSHDACDGKPTDKDGNTNQACLLDFRTDVCAIKHDFIMLTDHPDRFIDHEFPEVLLLDRKRGDTLLMRDGLAMANKITCTDKGAGDTHLTLLMAGCEGDTMPVGLEGHAGMDRAARAKAYRGKASVDSFDRLHKAGALVMAQHTENWTVKQLTTLPFDGFEMYNVHNNMLKRIKTIAKLIGVLTDPKRSPAPDLLLIPILFEDPLYLERWGTLLASGSHRVGTMGSDSHQNTLNLKLSDGQRVDRFRRLMSWFSNHLLIETDKTGSFDDRSLKSALKKGRLYGVFEVMGYAEGFDFHGRVGGDPKTIGSRVEMGDSPSLAAGLELVVRRPTVAGRDPKTTAPELTLRILRAKNGGFDVVAESKSGDLRWTVDKAGAYRAEVRMIPKHLAPWVGELKQIATDEQVWIYANPIYVQP